MERLKELEKVALEKEALLSAAAIKHSIGISDYRRGSGQFSFWVELESHHHMELYSFAFEWQGRRFRLRALLLNNSYQFEVVACDSGPVPEHKFKIEPREGISGSGLGPYDVPGDNYGYVIASVTFGQDFVDPPVLYSGINAVRETHFSVDHADEQLEALASEIKLLGELIDDLKLERVEVEVKGDRVHFDVTGKSYAASQPFTIGGVEFVLCLARVGKPDASLLLRPARWTNTKVYDVSIGDISHKRCCSRFYIPFTDTRGTLRVCVGYR